MNFNELLKDLKNREFKPVYLLHGEESYYIDKISDHIEENVLSPAERGFNQSVFYGKDADLINILNAAKQFPMMSDHQVIIIKEAQDLKWGKESDEIKKSADPFLSYLENPPQTTILVICFRNGKFDKRKKIYKSIEKKGVVFESSPINESKVSSWLEELVSELGYSIHPQASALMTEYLGNDLSKISNELEKLILNVRSGQQITAEHVQDNIGISKEYNVFELQNAISRKDAFKVNQIINYFAANPKSNPVYMLLGALNTFFTKILKYHYATDRSPQGIARELGISPYFIKEFDLAARNYSKTKVFHVMSYLRECDMKIKGVDSSGNTEQSELIRELMYKIIH